MTVIIGAIVAALTIIYAATRARAVMILAEIMLGVTAISALAAGEGLAAIMAGAAAGIAPLMGDY